MKWVIAVPAWGARAVDIFMRNGLPSLRAAMARLPHEYHFLVHTDQPAAFALALRRWPHTIRPCTAHEKYEQMSLCHADAIAFADKGDRVAMLCADTVLSHEVFEFCEERFNAGFEAVAAGSVRTLESASPPIGVDARTLLAWSFDHLHPINVETIYGEGRAYHLGAMLFRRGDSVIFRGFTVHPVAVVKRGSTAFFGTVDVDLLAKYAERGTVHYVTDYSMGITSTTPDDRRLELRAEPFTPLAAFKYLRRSKNIGPLHWEALTHRMPIKGDVVDCGDDAFVAEMLKIAEERLPRVTLQAK